MPDIGTQAKRSLKSDIRIIVVKGQRLRIAIHPGDGTGTPLLLLADIGSSLETLDPFVDEIDPALEIIRFDVPGTGGSPKPKYPNSLSAYAFLVAWMLDQLGYKQIYILPGLQFQHMRKKPASLFEISSCVVRRSRNIFNRIVIGYYFMIDLLLID